MKYKAMFKSWIFWGPILIFLVIHVSLIYQEYDNIGLVEIIAAFIFDFIVFGLLYSFFWSIAYGLKKTTYRKKNP